jgi:hypothetical protein
VPTLVVSATAVATYAFVFGYTTWLGSPAV